MKQHLKRSIKTLFLVLMWPVFLLFCLLAKLGREDSTFQGFSQALSLIPGKLGVYCRAAFYRLACPDTSDDISIGFLTLLSHRDTTIEAGVYIGPQCNIGKCTLGKNTLVGSGVHILSGNKQHGFNDLNTPMQAQQGVYTKIQIGEDCWLGNTSVIMADVALQCIVAAGSVVVKPLEEAQSIYAGNPAKWVRGRA